MSLVCLAEGISATRAVWEVVLKVLEPCRAGLEASTFPFNPFASLSSSLLASLSASISSSSRFISASRLARSSSADASSVLALVEALGSGFSINRDGQLRRRADD